MSTVPTGEPTFAEVIASRVVIRAADVPAAELPEPEPTAADLLAIEHGDEVVVQHRIDQALQLAAFEYTHRELMGLRDQYRDLAADDTDTDDIADVVSIPMPTPGFWRAA